MLTLDKLLIRQDDFELTADFQIETGARVAVIGPSGAGKSTLLALVSGFLQPSEGKVLWDNQNLTGLGPGERPLSILFQDQNLFPHLTISQNLALGIRPDLKLSVTEREQVDAALVRVGLEGLGGRKPAQLSGGQASRAALARVLLRARPLLLLDEPFAALGPALKLDMLDLVRDLAAEQGATVLMVTHDPADALRFAPQTIVVAEGRAEAPSPTEALLRAPPPALAAYLG